MANPPLDPSTHALIWEYSQQGLSQTQVVNAIAKSHGIKVAVGTVSKWKNVPPVKSDKKVGETSWREWVPALQRMQDLKKKGSSSQDRAVIELGDGKSPIALATFSDHHIGAWGANYEMLVSLTDELLNTPNLYIALLGDYGEYAIKLRSVLEVSSQILPPEQQTDFICSWFDEIWPKVAFATFDNHGVERQEKMAGESGLKRLLSKKVTYFNGMGRVDLKVGSQIYKGTVSHKFLGRSLHNPVHAIMRNMRFEATDCEWGMMGDSHVPGMMKYVDGEKVRIAINSGSLHMNSGFGKRYFSLTTHPVYPIIVFDPKDHEMTPFWSISEWLRQKK